MLNSLLIRNYQSHKRTELKLSSGVNAIIGSSDSGKTAILRAARWAAENRPSGDEFRSDWGGRTLVALTTSEDNKVTRSKGKNGNVYKLDDLAFKAFGTDIPEEIQQALNLNPINLQRQFDSPFLLSSNPGEVARHFNAVAHLDVIDKALKNVQKWVRQQEQDTRSAEDRLKELDESLECFVFIDEIDQRISELERLDEKKQQLQQDTIKLKGIANSLEQKGNEIGRYSKIVKLKEPVESVLNLYGVRDRSVQEIKALNHLIETIHLTDMHLKENEKMVVWQQPVEDVLALHTQRKRSAIEISRLATHIKAIQSTDDSLRTKKVELGKLKQKFQDEFPDVCPLCGQEVVV